MPAQGMYEVRKIHEVSQSIALPTCMYPVKNVHCSPANASNGVEGEAVETKDVEVLEEKQERILRQLEELKLQLQAIRRNNNQVATPLNKPIPADGSSVESSVFLPQLQAGRLNDIVVTAHPKHPPLSLLVLLNLLEDRMKIGTCCHVHSTVVPACPKLHKFFGKKPSAPRAQCQFTITMIWKMGDGIDPTMMIDPTSQSAVKGEANLMRYFSGLIPELSESSDPVRATEADVVLDLIHGSILHGSPKELQSALRQLNARLGKSKWITGNAAPALVDMVAWSVLQQTRLDSSSTPAHVLQWMTNCSNHALFQDARDYLK